MASSTGPNQEPYVYKRPSEMATRAIVDPANNPVTNTTDIGPEYHTPGLFPPHSQADVQHEAHQSPQAPVLHRRRTNNYEQAVDRAAAAAAAAGDGTDANPEHTDATAPQEAPGQQQLGWKTSDQKRANMERMLSGTAKSAGYTTSNAPSATK